MLNNNDLYFVYFSVYTCSGLKAAVGIVSTEHTISVVGALQLEKGQHVTVRVKHDSDTCELTILKDSTFMAYPLSQPAEHIVQ